MKPHHLSELAAALFVTQAAFAIIHRALGLDYVHFTHAYSVGADVALAVIWLSAAAVTLLRRSTFFFVIMLGCFASVTHGTLYSISEPFHGLPFFVAVAAVIAAMKYALPVWDHPIESRPLEDLRVHPLLHRHALHRT